jgi:hypothetical protein
VTFSSGEIRRILRIVDAKTDSFAALTKLAGLDPSRAFRGADLRGLNFGTDDLTGFDFTRADLRGADFSKVRGLLSIPANARHDEATKWPDIWRGSKPAKSQDTDGRHHVSSDDEDMSEFQRLALASLINYDLLMREREGNRITYHEIGLAAGLDKLVSVDNPTSARAEVSALVSNVVRKAGRKGALELKRYYWKLVRGGSHAFSNPPPHIEEAIRMLYPTAGDVPVPSGASQDERQNPYSLANVFSVIRYKDPELRHLLGRSYAGVWDTIRYSAHQLVSPERHSEADPWVVRAALEIGPIDIARGLKEPWFEVHYQPSGRRNIRKSAGSIILINRGHHFMLMGREYDVDAPFCVIAEFLHAVPDSFGGLELRRHPAGRFIASRVVCVRSKAKTIQELAGKIGIYRESELRAKSSGDFNDLDRCLFDALNLIPNEGKGVLVSG